MDMRSRPCQVVVIIFAVISSPPPAQAQMRLIGGSYSNEGRIEVYENERELWARVCDNDWDMADADVACRELGKGFSGADAILSGGTFGRGNDPLGITSLGCTGGESSLLDCRPLLYSHGCDGGSDAAVRCRAAVRLAGNSTHSGRVEVYHEGSWGTVCADGWDITDARVVCRELGYPGAVASYGGAHFGQGNGTIWLDDVQCTGREDSLTYCEHRGWGRHNCMHQQDAGVVCQTVRLVDGNSLIKGRVEVFHGGVWGTVCSKDWDKEDAHVVCRELGYPEAHDHDVVQTYYGAGSGLIWMDHVACTGEEVSLSDCAHRGWGIHGCTHKQDIGIICKALDIRLVNGSSEYEGNVEVLFNGTWGTVCDDGWGMDDARVVCKELGYSGAIKFTREGHFGQGSGPIWMDEMQCTGLENELSGCKHNGLGTHDCRPGEEAGVVCSDLRVRASPGVHTSSPTLEVSWSGTSDRLITFTVCYSTTYGMETSPPPDANCKRRLSRKHVTLDSLSTGTKYHIWVRPLWDLWQGNYSQRLSVYTYEAPSKVVNLSVIAKVKLGSPGLLLTWQQPHHDSRLKVVKYELRYRPDGIEQWTILSVLNETCLLQNLLPARTYQVQVRAISVVGRSELAGDWSELVEETTFGPPSKVVNLSVIAEVKLGSPGLLLTWQQPHHDSRLKVDKYELRYRPDDIEQWTILSVLNETCLLQNLLPARTYQVQVRAISVVGRSELAGDWSEVVEETTFGLLLPYYCVGCTDDDGLSTLHVLLITFGCFLVALVVFLAVLVGVVLWKRCCRRSSNLCGCPCSSPLTKVAGINLEKENTSEESGC